MEKNKQYPELWNAGGVSPICRTALKKTKQFIIGVDKQYGWYFKNKVTLVATV